METTILGLYRVITCAHLCGHFGWSFAPSAVPRGPITHGVTSPYVGHGAEFSGLISEAGVWA